MPDIRVKDKIMRSSNKKKTIFEKNNVEDVFG